MKIKDNLPQLFIVLIVAFSFILVFNHAKAQDNTVVNWLTNEKNEIVQYQKDNWQSGKDQLIRNKEQIGNLFNKVTSFFTSKLN
tara:strand:+ start:2042 stop:2293 length:252 start_codon:yes stop_codon:yes gene_type:complete